MVLYMRIKSLVGRERVLCYVGERHFVWGNSLKRALEGNKLNEEGGPRCDRLEELKESATSRAGATRQQSTQSIIIEVRAPGEIVSAASAITTRPRIVSRTELVPEKSTINQ